MEELYVKLKGKARQDKNVYSKEQVSTSDFTDDYGRLIKCGYVVFDYDEQPYIDIVSKIITESNLKCKMLITDRGLHFMFKTTLDKIKNRNKEFNWLGLKCDIKGLGIKEETKIAYQGIKVNGNVRKEKYLNGATTDEELDIAPKWLYHIPNKKDQIDLTEDQTGNRNGMFHHDLMILVKKKGISYEEYCEMAHIINDYVLPNPLDKKELETAIRFEEWEGIKIYDEKILWLNMALDVINYFDCKIYNGALIFFDESLGHYSNDENTIFRYIQEKYAGHNLTKNRMKEVITQMEIQLNYYKKYKCKRNEEYIVCGDKLVSMWKNDIRDITRTIVTDVIYPYTIMTVDELNNYNGIGKKFLNDISCNNQQIETVICECLGCMLSPENHFGKIFIWYGSGANGKSVLVKVMKAIMGDLLTSANILNINDRFGLSRAYKGIANVTDDIGITTLKETGLLKSIIDGSSIEIDRKNIDPIEWKPTSQFVMCCNQIPRIQDTTSGMLRRLAFIPFEMQLEKDRIDYDLTNKLLGKSQKLDENEKNDNALRYIMTKAIIAFRKAYNKGQLTTLEKQKELLKEFEEENQDTVLAFYKYLVDREGDIEKFKSWINNKVYEDIAAEYAHFRGFQTMEDIKDINRRTMLTRFNKLLPSNVLRERMTLGNQNYYRYILL